MAPKGKRTKKQRKGLKERREAFKRACKSVEKEKLPFNKTPKVSPPIDTNPTNEPKCQ